MQPEAMPGAQLCAARESQGLTAQDVAARLHLDTRTIENLEADAYRALPNEAYVRGYIRTYARLVNVDASPLLASYERHAEHGPTLTPFASMPEPQARAGDFPVKAVTYLVVGTLVALLVLWSWQTHNLSSLVTFAVPKWGQDASTSTASMPPVASAVATAPSDRPQAPQIDYSYPVIDNSAAPASAPPASDAPPQLSVPAAPEDAQAPPAADAMDDTQAPSAASDTGASDTVTGMPSGDAAASSESGADAIAPAASATGSVTEAGAPAVAADGQGLVLQVNDSDSWIDIFDGGGKKLYFNLARKGSRISVQGQLPYKVRIGHAQSVTILYQNKPLDVSAYTHQGVAHFLLTADGLSAP